MLVIVVKGDGRLDFIAEFNPEILIPKDMC